MPGRLEIVSSSLIRPVFDELKEAGLPVHRLIERSGMPGGTLELSAPFLPRVATQRFARNAVSTTGDSLLFYRASSAGIDGLLKKASTPVFGRNPPVYEKLTRFLDLASKASSAVRFHARVLNDLLWITRISSERREDENWYFEQYAIGALETVVSGLFGPTVRPVSIRLRSRPRLDSMPSHWHAMDKQRYQYQSAIAVPLEVLSTKHVQDPFSGVEHTTSEDGVNAADLVIAVSEYAKDPHLGIDNVADAFGMNRRTFQRGLARHGLTYSVLVEEIRFQNVIKLIKTPGVTVTEIALEAGYSSAENFTRAFRRRYGVPPTQYRELLRQD